MAVTLMDGARPLAAKLHNAWKRPGELLSGRLRLWP